MQLVRPSLEHLPSYCAALRSGWSPNTTDPAAGRRELAEIEADAPKFLDTLDDPAAEGPPIRLPDGSSVPRLPSIRRWMWDSGFVGTIGLRWQNGTTELPAHVLGHIGYTVLPEFRRRGYATRALSLILEHARDIPLGHVDLVTDPANVGSQRVIEANAGLRVRTFTMPSAYGGTEAILWRIDLTPG